MSLRAAWSALWQRTERRGLSWDLLRAGHSGWGISDAAGQVVTHKSAEHGLATVLGCVQGIASSIASLPAYVYVWQGDRRVLASTHPLQRLIDRGPNRHQSWSDFLEWLIASTLLRGNGVAEIVTDARGALIGLMPIAWDRISIVDLPGGMLGYDVIDDVRGGTRRLLEPEVLHLRDRSDDGIIGVSRLTRAAGTLGVAQALNEFTASMWRHGTHPSGALQTDSVLSEVARANLGRHIKEFHAGPRNAARVLLLEAGLKWQPLVVSPEDAELLASRRFTTEELARIFQVPPPLVGIWDHASFTNSETATRWYATHTLGPWISKIQAEAKRSLFSAATAPSHELGIDVAGLLRGDPELRWKSHEIAVKSGILTVNEIREQEGWPPLSEGDAITTSPTPLSNGAAGDATMITAQT